MLCSICIGLTTHANVDGQTKKQNLAPLKECWKYPTTDLGKQRMASNAANVYFAEEGARVSAVSIETGKKIWSTELGGEIVSNILINGSSVFVVTRTIPESGKANQPAQLRSLSTETGITSFMSELASYEDVTLGFSAGKIIIVTAEADIIAIDAKSGEIAWKRQLGGSLSALPVFSDDEIELATDEKTVFVVSAGDGDIRFTTKTSFTPTAVFFANKHIAWGDERGNVTVLDRNHSEVVWKLKTGARISSVTDPRSEILVTSFDNFIYFVMSANGGVRWKKRQAGRIADIPIIGKGVVVVQSYSDPTASFLDISNGKLVSQLNLAETDIFLQSPLFASDTFIFSTRTGLVSYSLTGCSAK